MANFPGDVVIDVFARLPVKSLLRFKCVSKQVGVDLLSDSKFIRNHKKNMKNSTENQELFILHRYGLNPEFMVLRIPNELEEGYQGVVEAVEIQAPPKLPGFCPLKRVAECDGMLCIPENRSIVVWNPSTKAYRRFWAPALDYIYGLGFCHDLDIDDYKVVNIISPSRTKPTTIRILRMKTGSWSTGQNNIQCRFDVGMHEMGNTLNGCIYWIGSKMNDDFGISGSLIVCFDIEAEMVREFKSPGDVILNKTRCVLGILEGSLCLMSISYGPAICYDVFVMKEETKSWNRQFSFPACHCPLNNPLQFSIYFTKNGQVLTNEYSKETQQDSDAAELFLYNPKDGSVKKIEVHGLGKFAIIPYVESLVSPGAWDARTG